MKKEILISAAALLVLAVALAGLLLFQQNTNENPSPQPPTPHIFPSAQPVTDEEADRAIESAVSDPDVKQWLDKGYDVYGVFRSGNITWVYLRTQEQRLPWVLGISLALSVSTGNPISVNFELTLANLTRQQKEQTLQVADETIRTYMGNATVDNVEVRYWGDSFGGKMMFHAYPTVSFTVPQDLSKVGQDVSIYVDLESGQVARVFTLPRKPLLIP